VPEPTRWPASLWLVRHGLSAGNIADEDAKRRGLHELDLAHRDMDVPLSPLGEKQARMTGEWIAQEPEERRPRHTLCSPYVRAEQTARILLEASGCPEDRMDIVLDERLREREFGILDRLTTSGIEQRHPEQAAARAFLGKFYHRPPGGESWADVALRLRSALDTIGREYAGEHLLVVTHQVAIMVFRYLLERLREQELLAIDRANPIANCSMTVYEYDPDAGPHGGMVLTRFNEVPPGEPVTKEDDAHVAPR
jgi:2,3-bisphosphoglycerate-dependent phosphoglycerate mutase